MFSLKSIVLIAAACIMGAESSAVTVAAPAPLVAEAHVGYTHAVPQNIPPYASQVNVFSRSLSPYAAAPFAAPFAAPYVAGPAPGFAAPGPYAVAPSGFAAPAPYALPGPYAAPASFAAPYAAPAPFAAPYAAPYPYAVGAGAPGFRSPYAVGPAFVR